MKKTKKSVKKQSAKKAQENETPVSPATEVEQAPEVPAAIVGEDVSAETIPAPKHRERKAKTETQGDEKPVLKRILKRKEKTDIPASAEEATFLQYDGLELNIADLKEKVISTYVEAGHRRGRISKLNLYIKPEDHKVYYVINDKISGSIDF